MSRSNLRHNFIVLGADFLFFGLALGFLNANTILPSFARLLDAPAVFVGLISALIHLSWNLPQLFAGPLIARLPRKKPLLMRVAFLGRPVIPLFGLAIFLTGAQPAWLILALLMLVVLLLFGSDAFAGVAWLDIVGRAFPAQRRAGYMSIWQALTSLGVLGVAALVRAVLSADGPPFPTNYALLFGAAGVMLMLSALAITLIREPDDDGDPDLPALNWGNLVGNLQSVWRGDPRFRLATISRVVFGLSAMAFPFYVLYATEELRLAPAVIGLFISAETVGALAGSLLLGRIVDRLGAQRGVQIVLGLLLSIPMFVLALDILGAGSILSRFYIWIYFCIGVSNNLVLLGYFNYVLDIAPARQRTVYIGMSNALGGLGVLGSVLGGWILSLAGYRVLFIVSLALALLGLALALRLPAPQVLSSEGAAEAD
ncbi:MAG: MFS transporter [Anaerolineae bacterium]